jgi:hypothetical protein
MSVNIRRGGGDEKIGRLGRKENPSGKRINPMNIYYGITTLWRSVSTKKEEVAVFP